MSPRTYVRPVRKEDLPQLMRLAGKAGVGLTTLPANRDVLASRIAASQAALADDVTTPGGQSYFFVLVSGRRVIGCSALIAAVGTEQAFYNYHVGRSVFASRELGVYRSIPTLYLSNDLTGSSELATLFVDPDWRQSGAGALISLCRFLFVAAHRRRFARRFIAELRGVADAQGRSPFWEGLGRQFFAMDFSVADMLSGAQTRSFIAELMPRHPVYTVLLPPEARAAIGEVHEHTRGARKILEAEGFRYRDYVDIFDAGPAVEADTASIRSVRRSRRAVARPAPARLCVQPAIVANTELADFRAIRTDIDIDGDAVLLQGADLKRLLVEPGGELIVRRL